MPAKVTVYRISGHTRSKVITEAMFKGIRKVGDAVEFKTSAAFVPNEGVAIFYGLAGKLSHAIKEQTEAGGTAVYIDLGYWGRRKGGRWSGYHKIVVNSRHPTAYFQNVEHAPDRLKTFGVHPAPWGEGRHILVAGMGPKAAQAEGMKDREWEIEAIRVLKEHTNRPIVYRPKPNAPKCSPIEGASFSPPTQALDAVLENCHAVVTHHSNVAVDGLVKGIPAFCAEGVSLPMGTSDLSLIEEPLRPDGRKQWLANLAYCQWSVAEMATGLPWAHLKNEGLLG